MRGEVVLDASVAIKCFLPEEDSPAAIAGVLAAPWTVAPDFIRLEIASVISKRFRRGDITDAVARDCLRAIRRIVNDFHPDEPLVPTAYAFAATHGCSAYDGLYLALAQARRCAVLTADRRLVERATTAGLGHLVQAL